MFQNSLKAAFIAWQVLLLSTKAGALGINLVAACHMIILDQLWNPVFNAQVRPTFRACIVLCPSS
jgi:SNF2 family DNA or RNA helicase